MLLDPSLSSRHTCNAWSHNPRKLCHTYLKLVQKISWSRCLSACDCVMTGCCNILSPFISRPTSDVVTSAPAPGPGSQLGSRRRDAAQRPDGSSGRGLDTADSERLSLALTTSLLTRWLIVRCPLMLVGRTLEMSGASCPIPPYLYH